MIEESAIPKQWEARLGVSRGANLISPSFKISKWKEEVYLSSKDLPGFKLSLHSSNIHRYAEDVTEPREPLFAAILADLPEVEFRTIARIIYTSETSELPKISPLPKKFYGIELTSRMQALELTIDLSSKHPHEFPSTIYPDHSMTKQVSANKFLTVSANTRKRFNALTGQLPIWLTPIDHRPLLGSPFDCNIMVYSTAKRTFIYWVHCGITSPDWWKHNPLAQSLIEIDRRFHDCLAFGWDPVQVREQKEAGRQRLGL